MARRRNTPSVVPTVRRAGATGSRSTRYPRHTWGIVARPFALQPMCIAPVSAGDSIKNIRFEARILTDPILDQITGWWAEMYWFYVRISNLDEADAARALVVTPDASLAGLDTTAKGWTYHGSAGLPDWLAMAMKPIVRTYFRTENGEWNDFLIAPTVGDPPAIPGAGLIGRSWLDTLSREADLPPITGGGSDDYSDRWEHYQNLRKQKLITMDFPEFLQSQGIIVPEQLQQPLPEKRKPELLRFTRQFSYPSNTVNPDGSGTVSAVSWVVAERMDRAIFCDEPGFIVGVTCVRPKLYRGKQVATGCAYIRDARSLVPDLLEDAPQEVLDVWTGGGGAIDTSTDYVHDLSAVYSLGDQFVVGGVPSTELPDPTSIAKVYPRMADVDELFADLGDAEANPPVPPSVYYRADGQAAFAITGRRHLATVPGYYTD